MTGNSTDDSTTSAEGRKVFLLYPHSVIHEEMMDNLIMNGFEAYTLWEHKRAIKILEEFPDSIMFINIDEGMPENEWEAYIKGIQENPKTKKTRMGILSYNQDKKLMEKYLMKLALPCGYIQLKLGIQESTKIILNALQANEAKGRRKFIRVFCPEDVNTVINFRIEEKIYQGKILDISSAGVAAKFQRFPSFPANTLLRDVQLKLRGSLIMTEVVLMGKRSDNINVWIFVFKPSSMNHDGKMVIHHFIKQNLQKYIEQIEV
jgi:hypothetical protein